MTNPEHESSDSRIGTLFLIPNTLANQAIDASLPAYDLSLIKSLHYFFVENRKTARRFLKACNVPTPFDDIDFRLLDKNTQLDDDFTLFEPIFMGNDMGLLSEAGTPAIADPGSGLIRKAHENGISVKPLVGPSSIFLALMGSGLNGQGFTFHGYLPVKSNERKKALRELDKNAKASGYTQIFMETPYRNDQLLADVYKACKPDTLLCVACDLTSPGEEILTVPVKDWQAMQRSFHKRPAIFLMNRP